MGLNVRLPTSYSKEQRVLLLAPTQHKEVVKLRYSLSALLYVGTNRI